MPNKISKITKEEIFFALIFISAHMLSMVNFIGAENGSILLFSYVILIVLSIGILQIVRFDFRSPVSILLVITSLYLTLRTSFANESYGIYYVTIIIAYNTFLLGMFLSLITYSNKHIKKIKFQYRNTFYLKIFTVFFILLYILLVQYILSKVGASGNLVTLIFSSLKTRLSIASQGLSPLLQLSFIVNTFGLSIAFVIWKITKEKKYLIIWFGVLLYYALVLGSRGAIVLPVLQIALAASIDSKNAIKVLIKIFLPIVLITMVFSTWFLSAREGKTNVDSSYSILSRFDAYENWLRVTAKHGLLVEPGSSLVDAPLQFIPRSLYPDKPFYYSTEMTKRFVPSGFNRGINLDFGGISESIYNFHLIGPLIFGFFIGLLCNFIRKIFDRALFQNSYIDAVIYSQSVLIPSSFFFVGWINSAMLLSIFVFFITYIILKFVQKLVVKKVVLV